MRLRKLNRNANSFSTASKCIIRWHFLRWHLTPLIQGSLRWLAIRAMNSKIWLPSETSLATDITSQRSNLSMISERCGLTIAIYTRMTKRSRIESLRSRSISIRFSNSLTSKIRPWWPHLLQFLNNPLLLPLHLQDNLLLVVQALKLLNQRQQEFKIARKRIRFSKNSTEWRNLALQAWKLNLQSNHRRSKINPWPKVLLTNSSLCSSKLIMTWWMLQRIRELRVRLRI